jgi:GH15 family glucan-1,4-alpha-glucosidase
MSGDDAAARPGPHSLRQYALLADGERGVLVGPRGDFAWMCFPRWHSDAIFSSLVGGRGAYTVAPAGRFVWGGYYEPGTLVWHSRWTVDSGATVECHEALALPADPARAVILRRIVAQQADARVQVELLPSGSFGRDPLTGARLGEDGTWSARSGAVGVRWAGAGDARAEPDGHGGTALRLALDLAAGSHHDLVLVLGAGDGGELPDPDRAWEDTRAEWARRVPELGGHAARDARHAYAVLAGLTSSSGGMVAAATTSLPERARQGRNYDYRYVWVRDQCYAGQAVAAAGPHALLDDAVAFVRDRLLDHGAQLRPAYTVCGRDVPQERALDLPGYPGGSDCVGNHARTQFQLDAFGEALLLFAAAARHDRVGDREWRAARVAAEAIAARWREPDAGIWELDDAPWTHSRLICAAGLRAIAAALSGSERERRERWLGLADTIVADTAAHALHPAGHWQRAPRDERVDAALLLPALRGAVAPGDPRSRATLAAVDERLTQDGYCYRFAAGDAALGAAEGAFLLCGFWLAMAWQQQGDDVRAARWFERTRAACGPPGLFSEEFDVRQRQLRGNLPQAFVHALLLECAATGG